MIWIMTTCPIPVLVHWFQNIVGAVAMAEMAEHCEGFESNQWRLGKHSGSDAWFSDHTIFMDFRWFGDFSFLGMLGRLNDWRVFQAMCAGQISARTAGGWAHSARRVLSEPAMQRNVRRVWCCLVMGTLCPHKSILSVIWHHISAEIRLTCIAFADWRLSGIVATIRALRRPSLRSSEENPHTLPTIYPFLAVGLFRTPVSSMKRVSL